MNFVSGGKSGRFTPLHLFVSVVLLAGCGGSSQAMRAMGEVSYAGEPIEEGNILFQPTAGGNAPTTGAKIKDGKYEIAREQGPLPNVTYRAVIEGVKTTGEIIVTPMEPEGMEVKANFIPQKYNKKSTLECEFIPGPDGIAKQDFVLEEAADP